MQYPQKKSLKTVFQNPTELVSKIKDGDRFALARALTILESNLDKDRHMAEQIIELCWQKNPETWRLGITGPPGVGKSTFIDKLGMHALTQGHKIAVLTIDPSSIVSHGSILGDKTRMETLSKEANVFIRPSPNQAFLGGLQKRTSEAILLCESAGYDLIIIETVGVGQSEINARHLVDCLTLLQLPDSGDELQGIKKGIMENVDFIVVHKAEDSKAELVKQAIEQLKSSVHLARASESGWETNIAQISSLDNKGIEDFYKNLNHFFKRIKNNNYININRRKQLFSQVNDHLKDLQSSHFDKVNLQFANFIASELDAGGKSPLAIAASLFKKTIEK